jgi:hypothetical protein
MASRCSRRSLAVPAARRGAAFERRGKRAVQVSRAVRGAIAGVLWTAAVLVGLFAVAGFVGGGAECARNQATSCDSPNAVVLIAGIAVAVALGIAGAVIWKPSAGARKPRRPWEYLD